MNSALKNKLWGLRRRLLETFWTLVGGQRRQAFSESYNFTPQTLFPSHSRMRLPAGDARSQLVRYVDYVQMHAICRYLEQLNKAPTVVEVGAFQGAYAVILGKLAQRRGGTIIALEPDPASYEQLIENVKRNGLEETVICEQLAVMDRTGHVAIMTKGSQTKVLTTADTSATRCESLEDILARHRVDEVDVMLIDVEGAELPVLRGFPWQTARAHRIFCEMHPYNWQHFGYDRDELLAFLRGKNLRCFDMFFIEHQQFDEQRYVGPTVLVPAVPGSAQVERESAARNFHNVTR